MTSTLNQQFDNLLTPFGSFDTWPDGVNSPPLGFEVTGGASVARDTTNVKHGIASAALTGNGCRLRRIDDNMAGGTAYYRRRTFSFGAWVRATVADRARITLGDNTGDSYSPNHSGGGNWEFLAVTRTFGANVNNFNVSGGGYDRAD